MKPPVLDKAISTERGKAQHDEIPGARHRTAAALVTEQGWSEPGDPSDRPPGAFKGGSAEGNSKQLLTATKKGLWGEQLP